MNKVKTLVASVGGVFASLFLASQVHAVSLIPTGSLTTALGDISDTGSDAFGQIIPVMITIAALVIGAGLIKRFLGRI